MGSGGGNIIHTVGVRIRVVGFGNLDLELRGYDNVLTQTLSPIAMSATNSREERRLANFVSQATKLKGSTNEINEVMRINHIIIFVKEYGVEYPG